MQHERYIDLHMHSTFSDGVLKPEKLVDMARRKNLSAISLSDHDSLNGYPDLLTAAVAADLEVIAGVEMSCEYNGSDLHILAYGVSLEDDAFESLLGRFREARMKRGIRITQKLADLGVHIEMADVLAKSGEGALGRPHIAEALIDAGHVSDFGEAFAKYLGEDGPAYVEKYKMGPAEAIAHIHNAGGLAFVAHPGYYISDEDSFEALLDEGFDGIEVHHPHHKGGVVKRLSGIATRRGLLISGGSDFHGLAGRDNMGEPKVPYDLLSRIKDKLA